jgi:membrane protein implicated in regulation of membrane protease activity
MEAVFLVCFLVGLSMTVISLVLGMGHLGGMHIGHGGHEIGHGDLHAHGSTTDTPSIAGGFLNLTTVMTFVTWFGGVGYLLARYTVVGGVASLIIASVSGIGGATIVALFITRVLEKGQTPQLREGDYEMSGTVARVSSTIYAGYAGEVIYTMAGTTQSAAARSVTDEEIPRGTEVVILKYERGTAFVDTWQHALGEGSDAHARA